MKDTKETRATRATTPPSHFASWQYHDEERERVAHAMTQGQAVFVFGSNLAGRHGRGAAQHAVRLYGSQYGKGVGHYGKSYAIPTKDAQIQTLPLDDIKRWVYTFLYFARKHPDLTFVVTRIGCGLAGYTDEEIAPLFKDAPANCALPIGWRELVAAEAA